MHAGDVGGLRSVTFGIDVGREIDVGALAHAVFLVDIFSAATEVS